MMPNVITDPEKTLWEREQLEAEERVAFEKRKEAEEVLKEYLKRRR